MDGRYVNNRRINTQVPYGKFYLLNTEYLTEGSAKPKNAVALIDAFFFSMLKQKFEVSLPPVKLIPNFDADYAKRVRSFYPIFNEVDADAQGRITIPEAILEKAFPERNKKAYLFSKGNCVLLSEEPIENLKSTSIDSIISLS
jgi:hypothetical protein